VTAVNIRPMQGIFQGKFLAARVRGTYGEHEATSRPRSTTYNGALWKRLVPHAASVCPVV